MASKKDIVCTLDGTLLNQIQGIIYCNACNFSDFEDCDLVNSQNKHLNKLILESSNDLTSRISIYNLHPEILKKYNLENKINKFNVVSDYISALITFPENEHRLLNNLELNLAQYGILINRQKDSFKLSLPLSFNEINIRLNQKLTLGKNVNLPEDIYLQSPDEYGYLTNLFNNNSKNNLEYEIFQKEKRTDFVCVHWARGAKILNWYVNNLIEKPSFKKETVLISSYLR